jgi:hypothetical protein
VLLHRVKHETVGRLSYMLIKFSDSSNNSRPLSEGWIVLFFIGKRGRNMLEDRSPIYQEDAEPPMPSGGAEQWPSAEQLASLVAAVRRPSMVQVRPPRTGKVVGDPSGW